MNQTILRLVLVFGVISAFGCRLEAGSLPSDEGESGVYDLSFDDIDEESYLEIAEKVRAIQSQYFSLESSEIQQRARDGDPLAQYEVGIRMLNGWESTEKDAAAGIEWLRRSSEQGYVRAQSALGYHYYDESSGLGRDTWQAYKFIRKAALAGACHAQATLGDMYEKGVGVPANYLEAEQWFQAAVAQGHSGAPLYLAKLYRKGGLKKAPEEILSWYLYAFAVNQYATDYDYESFLSTLPPDKMIAGQELAKTLYERFSKDVDRNYKKYTGIGSCWREIVQELEYLSNHKSSIKQTSGAE